MEQRSSNMKPDDSAGVCSEWEAQKLCEASLSIPLFGSEFPVEEIFKVPPWNHHQKTRKTCKAAGGGVRGRRPMPSAVYFGISPHSDAS